MVLFLEVSFVISRESGFLVFFCVAVLAQGIDGSMLHSSWVDLDKILS